jgi:hypothetical protein
LGPETGQPEATLERRFLARVKEWGQMFSLNLKYFTFNEKSKVSQNLEK